MDLPDSFEAIDLDDLQKLLTLLTESGASYFHYGPLKVGFGKAKADEDDDESPPVSGFGTLKTARQIAAEDIETEPQNPYERAFKGRLPEFLKD